MRVFLGHDLFEPPTQDTRLISFFNYAIENRHRIEADLEEPVVAAWLKSQSLRIREEVERAVDTSAELEAREPAATHAVIGNFASSEFGTNPLRIRIDDAGALLERPFSLLVEDVISDRAFLMTLLTPEERRSVEQREQRGYVRVDHGGGLPGMIRQLRERAADPLTPHVQWVLFDSDALRPGEPSRQSETLRADCAGIPHYQLQRRHIESYLPGSALSAWAFNNPRGTTRLTRQRLLDAFFGLTPKQRHHYNMKAGFDGDRDRTDGNAGDLYETVSPEDRAALSRGFDHRIGDLFQDGCVTEEALRKDSGWSELRPVMERLISLMR